MRLEANRLPHTMHKAVRRMQSVSQCPCGPMRRVAGFRLRRGFNNLFPQSGLRSGVLPSMIGPSGFIFTDGDQATLDKSVSPLADFVRWDLEPLGDHFVLQACGRQQDNVGAFGQADGDGSASGVFRQGLLVGSG